MDGRLIIALYSGVWNQYQWDILENYPRATFVVLDRAGHMLYIEQENLFNALVNEWLDRVEESAAAHLLAS